MSLRVPARTWGGRTAAERSAERRARLIDAAMAIWIDSGWAAVTMRGVCQRTALNDRYFYEHFADRDDLLGAAWDAVCAEVFADLAAVVAEQVDRPPLVLLRAAVTKAVALQSDHHGRARILLADHAGSAVLEQRRKTMLGDATELLVATARPHLAPGADEVELRMSTLVCIGGFIELLTAWRTGAMDIDGPRIIEHTCGIGALFAGRYLPPEVISADA
ncbi:TetR family transcriptional regulator [Nocardia brasiliensis]|uniref:TetR family transcriptional regulator n=1 Tax=Nocardia brasiliensis TaxID=37326 RepID=A0A6G9XLY6_NOCBR|nr:TetR/AcrR family transcriptional regulator [Nocardia brasiliensis]QIS01927.1 TetR family transcriptional regulator [Nocardia brasiliensis]